MAAFAAILCMAISYAIETVSWSVRAAAPKGMIGFYVSRSNIFLYFGRFFTLAYSALIAVGIERGANIHYVATVLFCGFFSTSILHFAMILSGRCERWLVGTACRLLFIKFDNVRSSRGSISIKGIITLPTATASLLFSVGITLPLLIAVIFPAYRLSLSYTGQIVNAAGTLLLLFLVDQRMFRSLDEGRLVEDMPSYIIGRALAFAAAGSLYLLLYLITMQM